MERSKEPKVRRCGSVGFKALMVTQFLGALNDNVFRFVVQLIIVSALVVQEDGVGYLAAAEALFLIPFIIFSPYAGFFADRYRKSTIIRVVKGLEVVIMSFGFYFLLEQNTVGLIMVLLFLGIHSTLFSPAKYGILPELLDDEELSRGNGYLEFWTFLAIIAGIVCGGVLKTLSHGNFIVPAVTVLVIAMCGLVASFFVAQTLPANPNARLRLNMFREVLFDLRRIWGNRGLMLTLLALGYFWFAGTLFKLNTIFYAKRLLGAGDMEIAILFACFAVGIGFGSILAGRVSEGKVELGLVPIGCVGMSLSAIALEFTSAHFTWTLVALSTLGLSAGFYVVPLNAYFQKNSPQAERGRYLAALNFTTFLSMVTSCLFVWVTLELLKVPANHLFLTLGALTILVSLYVIRTLPETLVRCINWLIMHTFYRVRVVGKENVPKTGGALLVCNHVSYLDPPLLLGCVERTIRFLMYKPIYDMKLVNPVARVMRTIPISSAQGPKAMVRSLLEARAAIEQGELVGIFAEGAITRLGGMLAFSKGFERIMKGLSAPIIPVHLDQVWGSIFSFKDGKFFWKLPKEIPYPVTVVFGEPLSPDTTAHQVRTAMQELGSNAFHYRRERYQLLHLGFLNMCRKHPFRKCMADSTGKKLNYLGALTSCLSLSRVLDKLGDSEEMVGVLLPPSVGGAVCNIAVLMSGRVPVNLNYTAGESSFRSAIHQCSIQTILTSRQFVSKLAIPELPGMIYIEDIHEELGLWPRIRCFLHAACLPLAILRRLYIRPRKRLSPSEKPKEPLDDLATVIFSSGSTGEPKGVMLSHGNIASNLASLYDVFQLRPRDCVMGVLPFFHSFGFTGTLWLPLLGGAGVVYHPNPIDAGKIGELIAEHRATILMATPTFLLGYLRKCTREQFESLRYIIVGAEKLKERLATAFFEKFGIEPMEGYGCTELSPVAIMNVPDYTEGRQRQVGRKLGTVGRPIPGVVVKVIDGETGAALPAETDGLLLVKGPNVMLGYLGNEAKTREVLRGEWYVTGDVARIDDEGFVTITDRLSRFSKIGGEMVPHLKIEEEIQRALGAVDQVCAVTAVADERKGERLVVLVTREVDAAELTRKLGDAGLPNLWIPKKENFYWVETLPVLGSGKLDLKEIKRLALDLVEKEQ